MNPTFAWGSSTSATWATTWPSGSPSAGPTPPWRTWCGGPGRPCRRSRPCPRPAPSAPSRLERRQALWGAGAVAQTADTRLEGVVVGTDAPQLPAMTGPELTAADLWATGVAPDSHVVQYARPRLDAAGVVSVAGMTQVPSGRRITVGGVVTHRQRPATANGTIFINLEDETGMANVICNAAVWAAHRRVARSSPALLIRGRLERAEGVTNLIAERIEPLSLSAAPAKSRDFRWGVGGVRGGQSLSVSRRLRTTPAWRRCARAPRPTPTPAPRRSPRPAPRRRRADRAAAPAARGWRRARPPG